eukprot:TRINITY_DN14362_c3_g1_i1.p1 TRINITY_DN14362_c3_g1~~TRINITY_DN14362_c3_g1_i1.p1  ORF type:complete len:103 (+),score=3.95 TRINITY_DN14362_c3_g1_i1:159-467(+)
MSHVSKKNPQGIFTSFSLSSGKPMFDNSKSRMIWASGLEFWKSSCLRIFRSDPLLIVGNPHLCEFTHQYQFFSLYASKCTNIEVKSLTIQILSGESLVWKEQ